MQSPTTSEPFTSSQIARVVYFTRSPVGQINVTDVGVAVPVIHCIDRFGELGGATFVDAYSNISPYRLALMFLRLPACIDPDPVVLIVRGFHASPSDFHIAFLVSILASLYIRESNFLLFPRMR